LLKKCQDKGIGQLMTSFMTGLKEAGIVTSIRDLLSWVEFINVVTEKGLNLAQSVLHGGKLVFIDGMPHSNASR